MNSDIISNSDNAETAPLTQEVKEEMISFQEALIPKGTSNNTNWGTAIYDRFNEKRAKPVELLEKDKQILSESLVSFYYTIRKKDGKLYTPSSLRGIRAAIHRYITSARNQGNINILTDPEFQKANKMLESMGKHYVKSPEAKPVQHKEAIKEDDLKLLGKWITSNGLSSPWNAIYSAWFMMCYMFAERGRELWTKLELGDLYFGEDEVGKFVTLHPERAIRLKNFQGGLNSSKIPPMQCKLYKQTDADICAYSVLETYRSKFGNIKESGNIRFFCYPLSNPLKTFYFNHNKPLGKTLISEFMPKLSDAAKLSKRYTNHQVGRNTPSSVLLLKGYTCDDVQYLTRHKDREQIKVYQGRLKKQQRIPSLHGALHQALGMDTTSYRQKEGKPESLIDSMLDEEDSYLLNAMDGYDEMNSKFVSIIF